MAAAVCLVLYGSSVFLAGIQVELEHGLAVERHRALELVTVEAGCPTAAGLILAHRPSAVLFDLSEGLPDFTAVLLRELPDLLLVGVDPSSNDLLVLSVKPHQALSMADLMEVINPKDSNCETFKGGNHEKNYQSW